jgi:hypothetical protein
MQLISVTEELTPVAEDRSLHLHVEPVKSPERGDIRSLGVEMALY